MGSATKFTLMKTATQIYYETKKEKCLRLGLCWNCCNRPSGGPGGTLRACSQCAKEKRDRANGKYVHQPRAIRPAELPRQRRFKRVEPQPVIVPVPVVILPSRTERLVSLAEKFPPSRLTREDIDSRKPVNQ